jgi:hypothetical protein
VKHCLSGDDKQYKEKRSEWLTSAPCEVKRSLEIPLGYWFTLETFDTFGYKSMEKKISGTFRPGKENSKEKEIMKRKESFWYFQL